MQDDRRRCARCSSAAPTPKLNKATAAARRRRDRQLRAGDHRVVQLLQRLRPDVHLVDGHAVQADRRGAAGLRDVPARQGRGRRRAGRADAGDRAAGARRRPRRSSRRCPTSPRSSRCRRTRCATSSRASTPAAGSRRRPRRPRRRRGGRRAGAAPAAPRDNRAWLAALKTLDFDTLSRNAQVDYLYIKRTRRDRASRASASRFRRARRARPTTSDIRGTPRGRDGLISDLQRQHDSVHARAAHRARQQGVRVVRGGDEEGVARDGLRRRLEEGGREDEETRTCRRAASRA